MLFCEYLSPKESERTIEILHRLEGADDEDDVDGALETRDGGRPWSDPGGEDGLKCDGVTM